MEMAGEVDSAKTRAERNRLGQFATPTELALDIVTYAQSLVTALGKVRFLDPGFGTGAFYSALLRTFPASHIAQALGYEIDQVCARKASKLWAQTSLTLLPEDFTQAVPPLSDEDKPNLLICNPPYVRHHHLVNGEKVRLQALVERITGLRLSALAGLYCYFLLISDQWLAKGGVALWLIPSEFMDVGYGRQVKKYLLQNVTLLRIHRFDPVMVQFEDALVSSVAVCFRKEKPPGDHEIEFSYGGTLQKPEVSTRVASGDLARLNKWSGIAGQARCAEPKNPEEIRLGDLFRIKRGLATGRNSFFILTAEQIRERGLPAEVFVPILPSSRYLMADEVEADADRMPLIKERLFLLSCNLPQDKLVAKYPRLWEYLQEGVQQGVDKRYLCKHRSLWYFPEQRRPAPLLCTYMGRRLARRQSPFRFILNHSRAVAPNVYLMLYPVPFLQGKLERRPGLMREVWMALKSIPFEGLMAEGRVYGGGLYKLEPRELANMPVDGFLGALSTEALDAAQMALPLLP
jgi:adenine-specific DNA-methyltransferase